MTRLALLSTIGLLGLGLQSGCVFYGGGGQAIGYELEPHTYRQDFGSASGTVPDVDCSVNAGLCAGIPHPPSTTTTCDTTTLRCVVIAEVRQVQTVSLASEPNFPTAVISAVSIKARVDSATYWGTNGTPLATPPIEIYVGPENAQREDSAGVTRFGTVASIPAQSGTNCRAGTPGTRESACSVDITSQGSDALARLANDFRTPFSILVVARITLRGGDPVPNGVLELSVSPRVSFTIGG
ncbi:MAG TPA: hypothetical protein VH877_20265 [Polyangia bacterium]|jgi:hypothetical protein|nr:hypothetical protein [Polyangia bacterium]